MSNRHAEAALNAIDGAADAFMEPKIAADHKRAIESEVWEQLEAGVKGGWCTQEEAEARFIRWRDTYIGSAVVEAAGIEPA